MSRVRLFARTVAFVLAFVVTCVVVDSAQAQRARGQRGGRGGRGGAEDSVSLAANEQVQKEINVTDEQKPKIEKIATAYREELQGLSSGGGQDLSREERAKQRAEQAPKRMEIAAKYEKELAGVLKEDQQKRLKEIALQVQGSAALLRPEVASALKLTDDQKKKIKDVLEAQMEKIAKSAADAQGGGDRDAMRKKFAEMRKANEEEITAVLTKDQQAQFASMKGKKFEMQRGERKSRDSA